MCTFENCRHLKTKGVLSVRGYRTIQLLIWLQNSVWRNGGMTICVGGIIQAESVALYILLTSVKRLTIFVIILFIIIAFDIVIVIYIVFKIMSRPYIKSRKLLHFMRHGTRWRFNAWLKRFSKSCPPLKLCNGGGKFFDRMSTILIWQSSVDLLITWLYL